MKLLSAVFLPPPPGHFEWVVAAECGSGRAEGLEGASSGRRQSEREWVVMIAAWWIICGAELIRFGSF